MDGGPASSGHWAEALFEAHAAGLILYGRALGLGHSESEDVVQDVFAILLRMQVPPRHPAQYLIRSFRNNALNRKRGLWRRLARELESREWFERPDEPHPQEATAMAALGELPEEQREVIVLRFWHGMTFEEVGEMTGVGANTAAGRYRYGVEQIRRRLRRETEVDLAECFDL
jgi:RNA polymerase sigma-70 factor (ECF subfamily)